MNVLELLILLLVAGVCGALGQRLAGVSRGGCFVSIAVGFIGALLGVWLARSLGLPEIFAFQAGAARFPIVWSIAGAAIFVAGLSLLSRKK